MSHPLLCFSLDFLFFFNDFLPPTPDHTHWHFDNAQVFPVRSSYHPWDSQDRKAGWLNRFSVVSCHQVLILFTGRFVIVITLKRHYFFIWHSDYTRRRLFPIGVYSYQDVFFYFINNSIVRRIGWGSLVVSAKRNNTIGHVSEVTQIEQLSCFTLKMCSVFSKNVLIHLLWALFCGFPSLSSFSLWQCFCFFNLSRCHIQQTYCIVLRPISPFARKSVCC